MNSDVTLRILGVAIPPVAVLVSGFLGFMGSQIVMRKQAKTRLDEHHRQARLVRHLLREEITERWMQVINPPLHKVAFEREGEERLRLFCTAKLNASDLYIVSAVASDFRAYWFLMNNDLVSRIVHAHLLYQDLIDFQTYISNFFDEHDDRSEMGKKREESKLKGLCEELPKKTRELEDRFQSILQMIGED